MGSDGRGGCAGARFSARVLFHFPEGQCGTPPVNRLNNPSILFPSPFHEYHRVHNSPLYPHIPLSHLYLFSTPTTTPQHPTTLQTDNHDEADASRIMQKFIFPLSPLSSFPPKNKTTKQHKQECVWCVSHTYPPCSRNHRDHPLLSQHSHRLITVSSP